MNSPLISVVVPYYNTNKDLFADCINSIVTQDYENKEIIIVDDGSKKEAAIEADTLANQNKCVYVIHQKNGGEGAARNTGIDHAKGKYVVFVDADDVLAPGWLSYAASLSEKYSCDMVCGKVVKCNQAPKHNCDYYDDLNTEYKVIHHEDIWKVQQDILRSYSQLVNNMPLIDPGVCSKLIRRDLIGDIRFQVGIKLSSDQAYNHTLICKCKSLILTNRISYYYVMNLESISHIYQPKAVDYMMQSMQIVSNNLINNDSVYQAFYYRVVFELTTAIQFAYYSTESNLTLRKRIKGVKYATSNPLAYESINKVEYSSIKGKIWKLKAFLLKHNMCACYVILKDITDKLQKR